MLCSYFTSLDYEWTPMWEDPNMASTKMHMLVKMSFIWPQTHPRREVQLSQVTESVSDSHTETWTCLPARKSTWTHLAEKGCGKVEEHRRHECQGITVAGGHIKNKDNMERYSECHIKTNRWKGQKWCWEEVKRLMKQGREGTNGRINQTSFHHPQPASFDPILPFNHPPSLHIFFKGTRPSLSAGIPPSTPLFCLLRKPCGIPFFSLSFFFVATLTNVNTFYFTSSPLRGTQKFHSQHISTRFFFLQNENISNTFLNKNWQNIVFLNWSNQYTDD